MQTRAVERLSCGPNDRRVLSWVNPKVVNISLREAHQFQSHQGDVVDERKIANDKVGKPVQAPHCVSMKNDPDFNSLPQTLQIKNATDRLVESPEIGRAHV